jgi:hypothetical protein
MAKPLPQRILESTLPLGCLAVAVTVALLHASRVPLYAKAEGAIGLLLGLLVCSFPSARFLTLLRFGWPESIRAASPQARVLWLALNALVLASGLALTMVATILFVSIQG